MFSYFKAASSAASRIFNREPVNFVKMPRWTVVLNTHKPKITEKYEPLPTILKCIASKPVETQQKLTIYYNESKN
jgi:hypothetical protein